MAMPADLSAIVEMLADDDFSQGRDQARGNLSSAYYQAFDRMAGQVGNHLVVAEVGGAVVGCMQVTIIFGISRMGATRALIEGVRVDRALRGRGIGQAMIKHAIELAKEEGCLLVQLTSGRDRVDARRFYERMGFVASHVGMKLDLSSL